MAELQQLEEALRRADRQGNTQDAQRLAQAIQQKRQETQPGWLGRQAQAVGDVATSAYEGLRSEVAGPEGLPDLPAFEATPPGIGGTLQAVGGFALTDDPEAQADIIREHYPGVELEPVEAEGKTYYIADYTDPETGEQHRGYLNPPGLDQRDVAQFAARTAQFSPAARFAAAGRGLTGAAGRRFGGQNIAGRATRGGGGAAATQYAAEKGAQALGSDQPTDWTTVGIAGIAGGGFETLSPLAQGAWRSIFRNQDYFSPSSGTLTKAGREAANKAGLDPDSLNPEAAREFARLARDGGRPETAARAARQSQFDIRGTRGQTTQEYPQLNVENRMRRGMEGQEAAQTMERFQRGQRADIEAGAERVQSTLRGGRDARPPEQAGEAALSGMRERARQERAGIDQAYQAVKEGMGESGFVGPSVRNLDDRVSTALADIDIDPTTTPAATRAISRLRENIGQFAEDGVSLRRIEQERRALNSLQDAAGNNTDRKAIREMRTAMDRWLDDSIDAGLFKGDPEIIDQLKNARALRRQYSQKFEQQGTDDLAGGIVERIMNRAETPEEAMNYIFGQSGIGNKPGATGALRRIKETLGPDSDEWAGMKEAAWTRMTRTREGQMATPKQFEKNFNTAKNQSRTLMNELFSPAERKTMQQYKEALESIYAEDPNPSKTASALEDTLKYTFRRLGQAATFRGDPIQSWALQYMARMPLPFGGAQAAQQRMGRQAISPMPSAPRRSPEAVAGATAGTMQRQQIEDEEGQRSLLDMILNAQ